MIHRYSISLALLFMLTQAAAGVTHTITTPGFSFDPNSITINLGDTIDFNIGGSHNVLEVSQATWNANGNTSNGGFQLPFGGGTLVLQSVGTYYYVCSPHASMGMKGTITVETPTITTGSIASSLFCKGASLSVPFSITGTFNSGNVFTAQLSDASGGFGSPVAIGTLNGTGGGQISATIPMGTPAGTGYRIRVVSSSPAVTGSNNGTNLTVLDAPGAVITAAGPTTFCEGGDVTLNANTGGGLSYIWTRNGSVIPGAASSSYVATVAGSYRVEVSNGSCSSISVPVLVTVHPADPSALTWTGAVSSGWSTVGNWDSPCATPTAGDTVIIGSGGTPPSGIPSISLGKFVLGNASGVSLAGDLTVTGELILNTGSITLGASNLTVAASGSISGGGASSFVITNGTGALRQAGIGSGGRTGNILFPVGANATDYTPVLFSNTGTQDEFSVRAAEGVLDGGSTGAPITGDVVGKTWFIDEANAGGSTAGMLFQWDAAHELAGFDRGACFVAHHDGSSWSPLQAEGPASGSGPYQRPVTGVTSFSPFAIGDGESPLPVEYRSFTADVHGGTVTLHWLTEREVNSAGFELQRAAGARGPWTPLLYVPSATGSTAGADYSAKDTPPSGGTWYYRLRQIDMDGSAHLSPALRIAVAAPQRSLAIASAFPNPISLSASGEAEIRFTVPEQGRAELALYNVLGQRVALLHDAYAEAGATVPVRFDASGLTPGAYIYQVRQNGRSAVLRTMIVR